MITDPEVLKRYRGWKQRQAAARLRQENFKARLEVNSIRRLYYEALASGMSPEKARDYAESKAKLHTAESESPEIENKEPDKVENKVSENQETENKEADSGDENKVSEINFDDLSNDDIKAALKEKNIEVAKNTARARLIELYKEHCM